ncbi:helix-turn-helix domain-containing protein [Actinoplanes sp. NPDC051851]|uniref:TetR/AcrR family transcriptional regulator n=1 Tax=Actinoplanes sp. NPDC051851 TaxID=3154753 RepID=UPI0034185368
MRSDAQQNRDRIIAAARAEFTEHGDGASLNRIAQRAGVGAGTLYRHFPSAQALLVAIITDDVAALHAHGTALLDHPDPAQAIRNWLAAVALHATAMRGLVATELVRGGPALADCHRAVRGVTEALLDRAGSAARADDVLTVVNAVAWASEHTPGAGLPRMLELIRV